MKRRFSRHLFAPEAVQTSAMDCGPAALKCLLEGYDVHVSYERLREACQTTVDGTSIDALEEVLNGFGLDCAQVLLPREHVLSADPGALPAIVIVTLPSGLNHFLVVWRVLGSFVQVMDPGRGRRWMRKRELAQQLYVHRAEIQADDFRAWAETDECRRALSRRLAALGVNDGAARVSAALAAPSWRAIAHLEASIRFVEEVTRDSELSRRQSREVFFALAAGSGQDDESFPPPATWMTRSSPRASESHPGQTLVIFRGTPVVRVAPKGSNPDNDGTDAVTGEGAMLPSELRNAIAAPAPSPGRVLWDLIVAQGRARPWLALTGLLLTGVGAAIEALLLRGLFDVQLRLRLVEQRVGAVATVAVFSFSLLLLDRPTTSILWATGRNLEGGLRRALAERIPRLADRYFQSRPISDFATRGHLVHLVRNLPLLGGHALRTLIDMLVIASSMIFLYPSGALWVVALTASVVIIPLLVQPFLVELDLRTRSHGSALATFYLDALLGLLPLRAHVGEGAVLREHDGRLSEWARSARDATRVAVVVEAATLLVGFAFCAILIHDYLARSQGNGWLILLVYWGVALPFLGQELAQLIQQYPQARNSTLRLLEPLLSESARPPENEVPAAGPPAAAGVAVQMSDVSVMAAGRELLSIESLIIGAGDHIAVVGNSGAGKSSLAGLLLGWHQSPEGVRCDGRALASEVLAKLRSETVWVDPAIQIWNRSLLANLRYHGADDAIRDALSDADLDDVLARLPIGLQTPLGEGGGLLSGGESQRVRLGRAIARGPARLVILDEPFRGLPRVQRRELLARARLRWAEATFLFITHDVADTIDFERVLVVDEGRIVEDGSPRALKADSSSRYHRMLEAEERLTRAFRAQRWQRWRVADGRIADTKTSGGPWKE